jgi:hypothetical protein
MAGGQKRMESSQWIEVPKLKMNMNKVGTSEEINGRIKEKRNFAHRFLIMKSSHGNEVCVLS